MAEGEMRNRAEEYEETVDPENPPGSTTPAAPVVVGLWYYLGPIVLLLMVAGLALVFWARGDDPREETVEPTTGIEEATPGGINPDPKLESPEEEREYRGGDRR